MEGLIHGTSRNKQLDGIVGDEIALRVEPGIPIAERATRVAGSQIYIGLWNLRYEVGYSRDEQITRSRSVQQNSEVVGPPPARGRAPAC